MSSAGEAVADTMLRWSIEDDIGEELDGWIYFIGCEALNAFKVGYTKHHPKKRLSQLQTGCPAPLVLIGWYPGSRACERELHEKLGDFSMSGEWFHIDEQANEILRDPVQFMQINNALTGWPA